MFQNEYKKAYDKIYADQSNLQELMMRAEEASFRKRGRFAGLLRPIAVLTLSFCLFFMLVIPALAEQFPGIYRVVQQFAPALSDYVLPEEVSDTRCGITLQVEAIRIDGCKAEVLLSFSDAEESRKNQIDGEVDLYDSYKIYNYGEKGVIGGCSFLQYDEAEDKAYFKVDITSDRGFDQCKVKFSVAKLLTHCSLEERRICMDDLTDCPGEKTVEYNGIGGTSENRGKMPFLIGDTASGSRLARVMNIADRSEALLEALTITGLSYDEGILRVQQCRGNFRDADRHIRVYLRDDEGNERIPDCNVGWKEKIGDEEVLFDESWFKLSEGELDNYELFGEYRITDNCVNGNWQVVVNLEKALED